MKVSIRFTKLILAAGLVWAHLLGGVISSDAYDHSLLVEKAVPVITLQNLSPPFKDYDYFKGVENFSFQFEATTFSLINAWWLAEISTLVYADEPFVRKRLEKVGLPNILFFDKRSTQCYVAYNDEFAILSFRGSEIWKRRETFDLDEILADLKADVDVRLVDWPSGGRVHRGFKGALDEIWSDLFPIIQALDRQGLKIWITGHSLGGALAILCGSLLGKSEGIYAFGSPKVGNADFRDHLSAKVYRVVNNDDIVDRTPSFFVYVHVGELKFIDRDGIIRNTLVEYEHPSGRPRDETYGQQSSMRSGNHSFRGFIPSPFRNHVPMLYAVHLWNNIIQNQQQGEEE